jgi:tRNA(Ile)-lysidine synthase
VLKERFPAYRETLSRASRNFSENALIQEEMASHDAINAISSNRLSIPALHRLSLPRAKNLLRHFLKRCGITAPSAIRLDDMLQQLLGARQDARINIRLGTFELRRFLDHAWIIPVTSQHSPNLNIAWQGENELWLDELGGSMKFRPVHGQGISQALLDRAPATLRLRHGGERLQLDCKRPHRSLKNLFQEAKIPPWLRQSLPMLYSGENLVAGIGIGIACAFHARPDEAGIMLEWQTTDGIVYS